MRILVPLCIAIIAVYAIKVPTRYLTDFEIEDLFKNWKVENKKSQEGQEHTVRLKIFAENYHKAVSHNNVEGISYTQGINQFSDLSSEEFNKK